MAELNTKYVVMLSKLKEIQKRDIRFFWDKTLFNCYLGSFSPNWEEVRNRARKRIPDEKRRILEKCQRLRDG